MTGALGETIDDALAAARRQGRGQWVAAVAPADPEIDPLALLAADDQDAFCYALPDSGLAIAARGAAASFELAGPSRFTEADAALRDASARLWTGPSTPDGVGPLWVGGFAFADAPTESAGWSGFPPARWWLPRELWLRRGGACWRVRIAPVAPEDDAAGVARALADAALHRTPPQRGASPATRSHTSLCPSSDAATHTARVARALGAIHRGELEKVVLARAVDVERAAPFDPLALLRALGAQHPQCAVFAVARAGGWFLGASPERLLRLAGRRVDAMALAGSAPRGRSPEEDAHLRRQLVESKKEQSEHAVVVRALRAALESSGAALHVPESPDVLALPGVQHLRTAIRGELTETGPGLLALAGRVHPSAAVAGAPRDPALAWLAANEDLERGWYAGLVGWMTPSGDGELSASLRCARLRGGRARLFAGGGIVAGSQPEAELRETRIKWNALLPALLEL